jgi:hypothetical protein
MPRYGWNIAKVGIKYQSIRARCTTLGDKVCQWLATYRRFSPGTLVSSTNKTDRHDITEMLLEMALSTIKKQTMWFFFFNENCTTCIESIKGHAGYSMMRPQQIDKGLIMCLFENDYCIRLKSSLCRICLKSV